MNPLILLTAPCQKSNLSTVRRFAMTAGISLLVLAGVSPSCSTTRGLGQDVEKTGEKIQDAASR